MYVVPNNPQPAVWTPLGMCGTCLHLCVTPPCLASTSASESRPRGQSQSSDLVNPCRPGLPAENCPIVSPLQLVPPGLAPPAPRCPIPEDKLEAWSKSARTWLLQISKDTLRTFPSHDRCGGVPEDRWRLLWELLQLPGHGTCGAFASSRCQQEEERRHCIRAKPGLPLCTRQGKGQCGAVEGLSAGAVDGGTSAAGIGWEEHSVTLVASPWGSESLFAPPLACCLQDGRRRSGGAGAGAGCFHPACP
jgi:hypothetical protein